MRFFVVASLLVAGPAFAAPNPDTRFRPGANHHVGDDSFVAREGRAPTSADTERVRMKVHLEHVRALLASRAATKPDLASRRAELLGYLDDYIAKGTTPENAHLPWRTAVFIDDAGAICAVGYLIERSVGRALPERIAATHRFDYLEDIAAAMPEVDAWIRTSGFTLEELASIQPAYSSPNVETWRTWDLVNHAPADGPYDQRGVAGTFRKNDMHGTWTVKSEEGIVLGKGELDRGNGTWRSFYADGKKPLAEGPYVNNVAHGAWTFFHPSGNVAAEGRFTKGMRIGRWRFYNDTKTKTPIAIGSFGQNGYVTDRWKHFDANGKLLAHTYHEGRGDRIDVIATTDGVVHQTHQFSDMLNGPTDEYGQTLERFALGDDQIYVHTSGYRGVTPYGGESPASEATIIYDADGSKLERATAGWTAADCHWSKKRTSIARSGDLSWTHEMLFAESTKRAIEVDRGDGYVIRMMKGDPGPTCGAPIALPAARSALIDKLIAPRTLMRAQSPTFVRELVLNESNLDGQLDDGDTEARSYDDNVNDDEDAETDADLRRVLAAYTVTYVQWPHIDGRFDRVFKTMAGRLSWEWHSSDPEADGTSPLENERYPGGD